jgi:hypothetical protein
MLTLKRLALLALIGSFVLAACAPSAAVTPEGEYYYDVNTRDGGSGGDADFFYGEVGAPAEEPAALPPGQAAQPDRLVIRNAALSLVVADPADAVERLTALAQSLNGFVVSSNTYQSSVDAEGRAVMQASITFRVPSAQLDAALAQARALAVRVRTENISGQDVTAQYTDLASRLRNLEAAEAQLVNIMDRATKTEDVLNVFNQLVYIREQIEVVKGQMQYYEQSAAMSAIAVELIPDALSRPLEVGGWQPQGVAKDALEALVRAFQGLATAVIWIGIYVLPLAVIVLLPLYLIGRLVVRRARRAKTT